jgi:3-hydroxybutyryl-CoA dehydrogenase
MGSGIAEVAARSRLDVVVREPTRQLLDAGRARIEKSMARAVEREKMTDVERDGVWKRLRFVVVLDVLTDRDIVIEAIVEDAAAKRELFSTLDRLCAAATIFASNTSSLPITDLAAATSRADRFVGLHFFNPVPVMTLVEVVRTVAASGETLARVLRLAERMGKVAIAAKDQSGFVVNLLLVPYLLDAVRQLERGAAGVRDIDLGMTLGCGHPMGPLALCDFVGIDTLYRISEIMYGEYREERYAPPPLLRRLVALGRLGRKTGRGFYDWELPDPRPLEL